MSRRVGRSKKAQQPRVSDADIHPLDEDVPEEDATLEWSDAPDFTIPSKPGDDVPTTDAPWWKYIEDGINSKTKQGMLLKQADAVLSKHPFASRIYERDGIKNTIDAFVRAGVPLRRYQSDAYQGSLKHKGNTGVGGQVGKKAQVAAARKNADDTHKLYAGALDEGQHLGRDKKPVEEPTLDAERHQNASQLAAEPFRVAGLTARPKARQRRRILAVHYQRFPHWKSPRRDAALFMRALDCGGIVRDHIHHKRGQLRRHPTGNVVNVGWMGVVDWCVALGMEALHVDAVAERMLRRLGRAGGATPCANSFLGPPKKPAPRGAALITGGVLRGAAPPERQLAVLRATAPRDDWNASPIVAVAVDASWSRLDESRELAEIAVRLVGPAAGFETVVRIGRTFTFEAHDVNGLTKTMLDRAGAPSLAESLDAVAHWLDDVVGDSEIVFVAHGEGEVERLREVAADAGSSVFERPFVDTRALARIVDPDLRRKSTSTDAYDLASLFTRATQRTLLPKSGARSHAKAVAHVLAWLLKREATSLDRFLQIYVERERERLAAEADADTDVDEGDAMDLDEGAGGRARVDMRRRAVVQEVVSTRFALRLFAPRGAAAPSRLKRRRPAVAVSSSRERVSPPPPSPPAQRRRTVDEAEAQSPGGVGPLVDEDDAGRQDPPTDDGHAVAAGHALGTLSAYVELYGSDPGSDGVFAYMRELVAAHYAGDPFYVRED